MPGNITLNTVCRAYEGATKRQSFVKYGADYRAHQNSRSLLRAFVNFCMGVVTGSFWSWKAGIEAQDKATKLQANLLPIARATLRLRPGGEQLIPIRNESLSASDLVVMEDHADDHFMIRCDDDGQVTIADAAGLWAEESPLVVPHTISELKTAMFREYLAAMRAQLPGDTIVLAGFDLTDVDCRGIDLEGCNFSGATLCRTNFSGCILRGMNFSDTEIVDVDFTDTDLTRANFSNARIIGTNFTGALMGGVNFQSAELWNCNFTEANAPRGNFVDTLIREPEGFGFRARSADFTDAEVINSRLTMSDLSGATISHENLEELCPALGESLAADRRLAATKIKSVTKQLRATGITSSETDVSSLSGESRGGRYSGVAYPGWAPCDPQLKYNPRYDPWFDHEALDFIQDRGFTCIVPPPKSSKPSTAMNSEECDLFRLAERGIYHFDPTHFSALACELQTSHTFGYIYRSITPENLSFNGGKIRLTSGLNTMAHMSEIVNGVNVTTPGYLHPQLRYGEYRGRPVWKDGKPYGHVDGVKIDQCSFFYSMYSVANRNTVGKFGRPALREFVETLPCHWELQVQLLDFLCDPVKYRLSEPLSDYLTALPAPVTGLSKSDVDSLPKLERRITRPKSVAQKPNVPESLDELESVASEPVASDTE